MRKIKLMALFVGLLASFSIASCSKDDSAAPVNTDGTTTGNYWPMAVDNQWTMTQDGSQTSTVKITGTDVFGGATYYLFSSGADLGVTIGLGELKSWNTKKGGTYYNKIGDLDITDEDGVSTKMKGYEVVAFKDYLPVGGSWTSLVNTEMIVGDEESSITIGMHVKYTGTILEKNVSETVNNVTYTDVIKMNLHQEMTYVLPSEVGGKMDPIIIDTEYWFAKDVGQIKIIGKVKDQSAESYLVDYIVKK